MKKKFEVYKYDLRNLLPKIKFLVVFAYSFTSYEQSETYFYLKTNFRF